MGDRQRAKVPLQCLPRPGEVAQAYGPSIEMVMQQDAELERNLGYTGGLSGRNK